MSRELYRARSKKVQKMGRDGLVEQDRATGEERRVGEKEADVSFCPERPTQERAADPARQRQRRQQARFRQERPERKTENSVVTDDWSVTPDMSVTDEGFPDAEMSAPEIPDAAPAMRGAVDTPMLTPTPVRDSEPIVIRRVRKPGATDAKAPKEPESGNRLKYDGGRRIAPQDSPTRTEGGAKPPPLRVAGDRPMAGRSSDGDAPRPARCFPDAGGRLQFDAERKPETAPDSRAAFKKQQARQFSGEAAKPERLHFESAKPIDSGGASAATAFHAPPEIRVISETAALSGVTDNSDEEQTDAATSAMDAAVTLHHVSSALRRPGTRKAERKARLKFQKDAEKRVPEEKRRDSKADAQGRQPDKAADAEKPDDSEESVTDAIADTGKKAVTDESGGRLQFERKERSDSSATHEKLKRKQDSPARYHSEASAQDELSANHVITRPEGKGRLQFEREERPVSDATSERPKRKQESSVRYRDASAKEIPPANGEYRPERPLEKTGRLNFEDAPSDAHEVRPATKRTVPGIAISAGRSLRFENAPPIFDSAARPEPDADSPFSDLDEPAQFAETPSANYDGERPLRPRTEDGGKLRFEAERKPDSVRNDNGTVTKRKAACPISDASAKTRNGDAVPGEIATQTFESDSVTPNETAPRPNIEEKRRPAIREDTGRLQFERQRIPEADVSETTPKKQKPRPISDVPAQFDGDIVPIESGAETAFPVPVTERRDAPAAYDNATNHHAKRPGVHEDSGRLRFEHGETAQSNVTATEAKQRTARPTPDAAPNRNANDKIIVANKTAPRPEETRPAVRNAKRPASTKIADITRRPQSVLALPEHNPATRQQVTSAQNPRNQRGVTSVLALPGHKAASTQREETTVQNLRDKESVTPVITSPECGAKPETPPQNPDASPGKSRLKFGAKPPKLTDDSKSPRKTPRLLFGIGKGVTSAKKEKVEKVEAELVIESDESGAKRRQRLRFERQETPVTVTLADSAPDKKSAGTEAKPRETELLTRTRPAKAKTDAANGERNADAEDSPPKRQRLQFEPEPKGAAQGQQDEGFTRNPPKREDAESTDAPPKKPRLRFEDKPDDKETETQSDAANQAAQVSESASSVRNAAVGNANANANNNVNAAMKSLLTRKDKEVIEAEARVEKAKRKLEKAKSKVPSKRRVKLEKEYDAKTGKVRRRLKFEKELMPEGAPLTPFPLRAAEGINRSARTALWMAEHQKIRETERQNVGVEAAHKGELIAEQAAGGVLRWNRRRLREKPYRAVRQAERALQKEQVNLEWRRNLQEHPELKRKRALAKWAQKQKIKRKYAAAAREAKKAEQHTQNVLNASGQIIRSVAQQVVARKSLLATVALLGMIVVMFSAGLTSCMAMVSSVQSSYISVSYMADEDDICESDLYYSEMETDLQIDINETETNHPGYDEYRYNIGEIGHNPYELLSYLSTKYNAFKFHRIRSNIADLFWKHYTLTRTVIVETRHDSEGNPYNWYVLKTTLSVRPLANVIAESLENDEERTRYGLYMQTYGNRQAFGNPFDFAWLGRVSSPYGYRIHPITGAKNLHRGVDIAVAEGTVIKAVQDGRVVSAGENGGYGLCVVIQDNKGYLSRYAHCSTVSVHAGQRVKRGDAIAAVGSTGSSTGPHLHLEVMLDGEYLNPYFFVETGDDGNGASPGGGGVVIPGYPGEPPTDETFARILEEAEKYLGYPYVWGGSSPSTSFDCSGFVSWVINHSGWNVGRLGAQGLYNICTPVSRAEARPGDLIFFTGTYSAPLPVTHVGIYVGNEQMLHCGNPIQYASINTNYWNRHFYAFGRLP